MLPAAHAFASVTYTYTGKAYTNGVTDGTGHPGLEDPSFYGYNLTGSVTFDDTVTADFSGTVDQSHVTGWYFKSGVISELATQGNGLDATFKLSNGAITFWDLTAYDPSYVLTTLGDPLGAIAFFFDTAGTNNGGNALEDGNVNDYFSKNPDGSFGNGPGIWAEVSPPPPPATSVPEPSSWAMLMAGFGIIGLAARRSRQAAAGHA
ncbi:PEPxxWA-CTERM sorting domain-containing protein [Sphingomonas nostoxanthinifaciens]|nr:PEPxxWA-CTERM sorting domain-containing protein [Sphingomonas nostoxanthinifaciens]